MKAKQLLTALLFISCIVSGIILAAVPSYRVNELELNGGLDSLIVAEFTDHRISDDQFRRYDIEVDSTFSRTVYRVQVPPSFSKTLFHYTLHQKLYNYKLTSPARILFPEKDMNIYIVDQGTIRSTIRLLTTNPADLED